MTKRLNWVDVAKCFGIFAIYLGHCGTAAGNVYQFVFRFHVPLFFLLSGCMETNGEALPICKTALKTIKQILIPWLIYCFAAVAVNVLAFNGSLSDIRMYLAAILRGTVRNDFFAGGLWFLPCLAVVKIMFSFLRKLKFKVVILLVCGAMLWITQYRFPHNPLVQPSWMFNLDSAMYYIFYYAVGYVSFPYVCRLLEPKTQIGKASLILSAAVAFCISVLLFFNRDGFLVIVCKAPYFGAFGYVLAALVIIWLIFVAARLCQDVDIFKKVGRNTLHLCGGEYAVTLLFQCVLEMLGLRVNLTSPLVTVCYVALMLVLGNYFFVPIAKQIINWVMAIPEYLGAKQK